MAKNKQTAEEKPPFSLHVVLQSFKDKVRGYSSSQVQSKVTVWGIVAVISLVAAGALSAFSINEILDNWLPAIAGFPASVIIALMLLANGYRNANDEAGFYSLKTRKSYKQRLWIVLLSLVVTLSALLLVSRLLVPWGYGIGGVIVISFIFVAVAFTLRTPEEIALSLEGLPDPRDLPEDEEDRYADMQREPESDTTQPEPDTERVYYKENGRLGGKL